MIGQVIAEKYEILSLLGKGAMGRVYAAHHAPLGRKVAIKILSDEVAKQSWGPKRFNAEARAASRLDHPHSVQITDFGEADGRLYLVMELLQGQGLRELLKRTGRMSELRACKITSQVLSALAVAHQNGVIHRDLKPANIILIKKPDWPAEEDFAKVCDFGIAKLQEISDSDDPTALQTLTKHGQPIGTPAFMSPEQAQGLKVDARTDLYACGVMLYRMVTGKNPYTAENVNGLLSQVIMGQFRPPSQLVSTINPKLEQVIIMAMAKSPANRFGSARDMKAAIDAILNGDDEVPLGTLGGGRAMQLPINQPPPSPGIADTVALPVASSQTGAPFQSVTSASWQTRTSMPPPAERFKATWIIAALVVAALAGLAAIVLRPSEDTGDSVRLSEMIAQGAYGVAESYALQHHATFGSDPDVLSMVRNTMRQRRNAEGYERELAVRYDPATAIVGTTHWSGTIEEAPGKKLALKIQLAAQDGVVTGHVEYPDMGLRAKLCGYVDGNHILVWDYELEMALEQFKDQYQVYDKYHAFVNGNEMKGLVGAERRVFEMRLDTGQ